MWQQLLANLINGDPKALARTISLVENEAGDHDKLLEHLQFGSKQNIIGITGAPGSGKSTLVDALIGALVAKGKKVGVLCVDPSSPFNLGALLGDRIRMSEWYSHEQVFIRSLASRGSLGGLNPRIIEISSVMQAAGFDQVIIETVGVGQSEIEIAGLADLTIVVLVPEGGDEIQTMKAGLMEIADAFVLNKGDRPGADLFLKNLRMMLAPAFSNHAEEVPIFKTIASQREGIDELAEWILNSEPAMHDSKKFRLLAERAWQLIRDSRMKDINKIGLEEAIRKETGERPFNLYKFVKNYR